jgi:hypothetical protein
MIIMGLCETLAGESLEDANPYDTPKILTIPRFPLAFRNTGIHSPSP